MIPVDATRFQAIATGIVSPVQEWVETSDGKRRPSDVQASNAQGQPLWSVEILRMVSRFGRDSTETTTVTVPSPTEPHVVALKQCHLQGLEVEFFVSKGQGRERWSASGIQSQGESKQAAAQS